MKEIQDFITECKLSGKMSQSTIKSYQCDLNKLQEYLDCGIVLGDNLIVTSDNADHRTNEIMIREALDKIKKRMFA